MTITDYIAQGGTIAWILLAMNIIGYALIVWKGIILIQFNKKIQPFIPDQIIQKITQHSFASSTIQLEVIKTEILLVFTPLESGLMTIKNIAVSAPLLGLLGTVLGIYSSFDTIESVGLKDPALFAGGIKLALVTTVIGLIVAIPHLLAYNYLTGLLDTEQNEVENEVIAHLGTEKI